MCKWKNRPYKVGFLSYLFFGICIAALIYGVVCTCVTSVAKVATWIWYIIGVFFFVVGILFFLRKNSIRFVRVPKWLTAIITIALAMFLLLFVTVEIGILSHFGDVPEKEPEYLIVLGAGMKNGKPSIHLKSRIKTAGEYLLEHPDVTVICCGGQGSDEPISEAACIAEGLVAMGIGEERIILEDQSTRTQENLEYASKNIPEGASIGIVTNNYHVFRARKYALSQGFSEVYALAAPYSGVMLVHYVVREFVAFSRDALFGAFTMAGFFD